MKTKPVFLDFVIIAVIIAIAVLLICCPLFISHSGEYVSVAVRGNDTVYRYSLDTDAEYTVEGNSGVTLTLVISDGYAYVKDSECPDKVCVSSGKINRTGQSIICAPAGISIIVSGGDGDADHIAG